MRPAIGSNVRITCTHWKKAASFPSISRFKKIGKDWSDVKTPTFLLYEDRWQFLKHGIVNTSKNKTKKWDERVPIFHVQEIKFETTQGELGFVAFLSRFFVSSITTQQFNNQGLSSLVFFVLLISLCLFLALQFFSFFLLCWFCLSVNSFFSTQDWINLKS